MDGGHEIVTLVCNPVKLKLSSSKLKIERNNKTRIVSQLFLKRVTKTIIYFPYLLSWVILSGFLIDILSPSNGIINTLIQSLRFDSIYFLSDNN